MTQQEYSDVLLTSYLASLTKELGPFNDVRRPKQQRLPGLIADTHTVG